MKPARCFSVVFFLLSLSYADAARIPAPEEYLGFSPGTDYRLADYDQITGYFHRIDQLSDRLKLLRVGESSYGRPLYVAFISSAGNLRDLEKYREISKRLALGLASEEEAERLARQGRVIVWIDSGLHATEVAPAQHAPELAYWLVSSEDEVVRKIRENVILIQVPVINPDGLELVVNWYRRNVGTAFELAPLPFLYQRYAGHDNNRDWFMMNLAETRVFSRLLFQEWFPQIVYNQHQRPAFPARIFIPPYAEPLNSNIPAGILEGIHLIGSAMRERLSLSGKSGFLSYFGFDAWWNGGLRTTVCFHNMHGILTETALYEYATPRIYRADELPSRFGNGLPTKVPSIFYPKPWAGGRWGLRDAIEYILETDMALLELAAARRESFLLKAYWLAREAIRQGERGEPFAYVIPAEQWDRSAMVELLERLHLGGVRIHRATETFQAEGREYPAGTFVVKAGQAFRAYLMDLLEPQYYPHIEKGEGTVRPYDVAGWTLALQMGVSVHRIDRPFEASLEEVEEFEKPEGVLELRNTGTYQMVAKLLRQGRTLRLLKNGRLLTDDRARQAADGWVIQLPRIGVYESWIPNSDSGWTQWLLDYYGFPYRVLRNEDLRTGATISNLNCVIIPSQGLDSILNGFPCNQLLKPGPRDDLPREPNSYQRPEYCGGIGADGVAQLQNFVEGGGTLILLGAACQLGLELMGLPVRNRPETRLPDGRRVRFECPGSLLWIDMEPGHPVTLGSPARVAAFSTGGFAFETDEQPASTRRNPVQFIARYSRDELLASGWVRGEEAVRGKAAVVEVRVGKGRVYLFGIRPQFRGQSFGTFRLLLNAILQSAAKTTSAGS